MMSQNQICAWKRCVFVNKEDAPPPLVMCVVRYGGCGKMLHQVCFINKIKKKTESLMIGNEEQKYYSKVCYKKIESFVKRHDNSSLNWDEDSIDPTKNGTQSSIAVLLQWWCTEGNWARYRGKGNNGATKLQFCQGIADAINRTVIFARTAKGKHAKIERIHERFKQAHYFVNSATGAGVREKDGSITFKTKVMEICEHYYDLEAIMGDRAGTMPAITSDSHFIDWPSSESEDELIATEQNFVTIDSSSDAIDGESKKCDSGSDSDNEDIKPTSKNDNDGEFPVSKKLRSSSFTVNPSNSEVIGKKPMSKDDNDGEFPLSKKPRSSPFTVNPSNSGVIGKKPTRKNDNDGEFPLPKKPRSSPFTVNPSNSEVIGKKPTRRNDNDGEFSVLKKPRSSPLTVNPSNSGVIGGGYVNKKKVMMMLLTKLTN